MRNKRRFNNIKILQDKIQSLAIKNEDKNEPTASVSGYGSKNEVMKEVLLMVKPVKKKGIKKDELINTKRLLTM
jgi:hypothetical protein